MHNVVKILKSLSDETRLRILNILLERECCVCEVMQSLDISQTRASRNLGILYAAGFIKLRKDGLWSVYSIDWNGMDTYLTDILEATNKTFKRKEEMETDRERLKTANRVGPDYVNKERRTRLNSAALKS